MRQETTIIPIDIPDDPSLSMLDSVLREGGRHLLQATIEFEAAAMIERLSDVRDGFGRQAIVRNGSMPEREIATPVGRLSVKQPRVRDRRPAEERMTLASCWFWDCMPGIDPPPPAPETQSGCVIYKCGEATCCWRKYKVCWENEKRVIKEVVGGTITGVTCSNPSYCDTYCDVLRLQGHATMIPPAQWKPVVPPTTEPAEVSIAEMNESSLTLRTALHGRTVTGYDVTDVKGSVVRSMSSTARSSASAVVIETRGLASGTYVITLRLSDGTNVAKGVTIAR